MFYGITDKRLAEAIRKGSASSSEKERRNSRKREFTVDCGANENGLSRRKLKPLFDFI